MLLPLQGAWILPLTITQGVALGYVLLGFQPVLLITIRNYLLRPFTFDMPSYSPLITLVRHFQFSNKELILLFA